LHNLEGEDRARVQLATMSKQVRGVA
jgi:hypothetical protein